MIYKYTCFSDHCFFDGYCSYLSQCLLIMYGLPYIMAYAPSSVIMSLSTLGSNYFTYL